MRRVLAAVAVSLAVLVAATPARAGFAPTGDFIAGALQFAATGHAIDADGDSIYAWSQKQTLGSPFEVKFRRLGVGGELGPETDLAPGEIGFRPVIAMGASGRAFAAWRWETAEGVDDGVKGRWIETDGSLGPLLTLVAASPGTVAVVDVRVAIDAAGVAAVSWENEETSTVSVRRVLPDGSLTKTALDISDSGVGEHDIAALPDGSTLVLWRSGDDIESNVVSPNMEFGAPDELSPDSSANAALAVDALGNALAVWRESAAGYSVKGHRLSPTGDPVGGELTIDPEAAGFVGTQVRASADSTGNFLVSWNRQDAEGDAIAYARSVNSDAVFGGAAQPLSSDTGEASAQQAVLEDDGTGATVWSEGNEVNVTLARTLGQFGFPTGGIQELFNESIGQNEFSSAPAAGVIAFLTEYATSGASDAAVVRRFLVPPVCADSNATVVQGQPIEAPLACTGPAIEGALPIEGPRHGRVGAFSASGPALTYTPKPGFAGTDTFAYVASNDGGSSGVARVVIKVGKDTKKPRIEKLNFTQRRIRKSFPRNYQFRVKVSEPAFVKVTVERRAAGIRKGKRCLKPDKGLTGKRCTRFVKIGTRRSNGANRKPTIGAGGKSKLTKRLARGGRFRATAVATDLAGNKSPAKQLLLRAKADTRG